MRNASPPTDVTRRAETVTMKRDRRFLWLWLTAATFCSVVGNVGHAIVEGMSRAASSAVSLTSDPLFWASVGWAVVPPLLLMLAVHGLPTLARMLGTENTDLMLKLVVWGVVLAAFGWSAFGIYTFTVSVGVPAPLAVLAPLAIDLSVFGATRGLVKTALIAARMKLTDESPQVETHVLTHEAPLEEHTVEQGLAPREAREEHPVEHPVFTDEPLEEHTVERPALTDEALVAHLVERTPRRAEPVREALVNRRDEFSLTVPAEVLAQRIVTETTISAPPRTVAAVLKRASEGASQRKISAALKGVSPTTVGRILAAAKEMQTEPETELVAV